MTSRLKVLAGLSTAVLGSAIVAVLVLRMLGAPLGAGEATPTPGTTLTPATPSLVASPTPDELTLLGEIEAQVSQLRGLPAADVGPPRILSRSALAAELSRIIARDYPPEQQATDNAVLRALGLLGADQDVGALTEQLYAAQVLGFYDAARKQMVVVSDAGLDPQAQMTYAHEYTHALQDAAFDIGSTNEALVGDDDATLAQVGLEEGDATLSMVLWGSAHLSPEQLLGVVNTPIPDMSGIPAWMVSELELPYLSGAAFVGGLYGQGGLAAVDAAYADPPATTEQLMHADKYAVHEPPVSVTGLDLAAALSAATGETWHSTQATTFGEAMTGIWLAGIGATRDAADAAAAGWGGDHLDLASGPDGTWVLALRQAWDTSTDADEFEETYAGLAPQLGFAARVMRLDPTDTLVLQGSSGALLDQAVSAITP